jgi:DNA-binding PadR family transcriptional regulator
MAVSRALLALLESEQAYGYTLKRRYDAQFARTRPVSFGQVYASLARFQREGLAEVVRVQAGDGPDRRLYDITPLGVAAVDAWVHEPAPPTMFATSELFAKTTVALLSGRDAHRVLDTQRVAHLARMRDLVRDRPGATGATLLSITYELEHLDADIRWIEDAVRRLAQLERDLARTDPS